MRYAPRMSEIPADPADHAQDFAERYAADLELYCAQRMRDLGIPDDMNGAADPLLGKPWRAFDPEDRRGGTISDGIVVDSGVLNPELLRGQQGRPRLGGREAEESDRLGHRARMGGGPPRQPRDGAEGGGSHRPADHARRAADLPGDGALKNSSPACVSL